MVKMVKMGNGKWEMVNGKWKWPDARSVAEQLVFLVVSQHILPK